MKPTMQLVFAVAVATLLAVVSCSSIYKADSVDAMGQSVFQQSQSVQFNQAEDQDDDDDSSSSEEDSDELSMETRSLLSSIKTLASLVSTATSSNSSLEETLLTAAAAVADVALTAATGSEEGAALAKTAIGVVGEALEALSTKLSDSSLGNSTLASALLNTTYSLGSLLSEYGDGNETVSTVVSLVQSVISGNVTLKSALAEAGIALLDNALTPTKEKLTIAGKAIQVVGGVVETVGSTISDSANSSTEAVLDEIISKIGAESIVNTTFTVVDNLLNITLEDIISEKLEELDNSTATLKEKVVAIAEVIETIGETLVTIGETSEDLGSSSVSDYASIIKAALSELTSSSSDDSTSSTEATSTTDSSS